MDKHGSSDPLPPGKFHSSYDPHAEADRFLRLSIHDKYPSVMLLIGPGEDWLGECARARFPECRIVSIQLSAIFRGVEREGADLRWYPDSGFALDAFLDEALRGRMDGGVSVLAWKPVCSSFPEQADFAWNAIKSSMEFNASERASIRYWGFTWLWNTIRMIVDVNRWAYPRSVIHGSSIIVCPGSSAESIIHQVARIDPGKRPFIIALSSASCALEHSGIVPDLLVSTDPGFWSQRHLARTTTPLLACPLTAAVGSRILSSKTIIPILQDSPWEQDAMRALGIRALPIDAFGTVAGTAIALALRICDGPVLVAGLDLASRDIRSHARPNMLDEVVSQGAQRCMPAYSKVWERETSLFPRTMGSWRVGRSFSAYARGFDTFDFAGRVLRFSDSPLEIPGIKNLQPEEFLNVALSDASPAASPFSFMDASNREERIRIAGALLDSWHVNADDALETSIRSWEKTENYDLVEALAGKGSAALSADLARKRELEAHREPTRQAIRSGIAALKSRILP